MAKTKGGNASGRRLQVDYMTRTERVQAAVNGAEVDRVPVCFWHHFQPEGSGRAMAEATLRFFDEEFDLDIAKVMPDLPYPFPKKSISVDRRLAADRADRPGSLPVSFASAPSRSRSCATRSASTRRSS